MFQCEDEEEGGTAALGGRTGAGCKEQSRAEVSVMMKTKRRRHVSVLLPNKQHLDCSVSVRARGQEVMNSVLRQLGVSDLQVFGLGVLRDNEYLFLDLTKKLSKYFNKRWNRGYLRVPFILFLRIQFYVGSGLLILSSKVQQLYFTELRQKVLCSQSYHQEALLFQLAASALQAEVGDQELREEADNEGREAEQERKHYFLPEDYFPFWLIKRRGRDYLLRHSPTLHSELRGLSQSRAVLQFIKESSRLQDGAVTFYRMKQDKKEKRSSILLGVAGTGVHVYLDMEGKHCAMFDFSWPDIDHLTFQGCRFEIGVVASLGLPKLVYYTRSAVHSEHILRHLRNTHQFHISTRAAAGCIQQLEDLQASHFHKEAYICDVAGLRQSLSCSYLTSSTSDCSAAVETVTVWTEEEEEGSSTGQLKGENIF
ncbi:FERM domain-containing protein 6-like [Nematolebias whitei]|uniref:FERM domain-containing protein 6-like n=1 Tax=Nematolebias whitei TaxID=451745 RepID=UPI001897E4D3|nr:FERM domain-containing protein 6-like [Nematolebias whitei]